MKEWADRAKETDLSYGSTKKMPVEVMVDLANKADVNPWFTMPAEASDDYMRQFAIYVRDHLESDKKIYLEWSNETWNNGYPGADWSLAKGAELGISGWKYHAYRAVQMFRIWDDVFNEPHLRKDRSSSRIVRLLASQNGYTAIGTTIMDYNGLGLLPGVPNPFEPDKKAADYADALTVSFYLNETVLQAATDWDTKSADEVFDLLKSDIVATMSPGGTRYTNITAARARGLDTVIYEGGPHIGSDVQTLYASGTVASASGSTIQLAAGGASPVNNAYNGRIVLIGYGPGKGEYKKIMTYDGNTRVATLDSTWSTAPTNQSGYTIMLERHFKQDAVNRHPRMKELYLAILDSWKAMRIDGNVGPTLWTQYHAIGPYNNWGRWGLIEYYDQDLSTAYKWLGIKEFIDTNPKWWTD
jgi:hypothetical protein